MAVIIKADKGLRINDKGGQGRDAAGVFKQETRDKRQATTFSGCNVFCRSDKDRRDASDKATKWSPFL